MYKTCLHVFLGFLTVAKVNGNCIAIPDLPCACEYDGKLIDLSFGGVTAPLFAKHNTTTDGYTFNVNPCDALARADQKCLDLQSSICQTDIPHDDPDARVSYAAGSLPIEYTGTPEKDLQFVYSTQESYGGHRKSVLNIDCDPDRAEAELIYDDEVTSHADPPVTTYFFTLSGAACCLREQTSNGLSAGSVLLILFFVGLALYIIGGMLFNKCVRGFVGKEIFPNYEFWADFPSLVSDGFKFTISCGCCANTTDSQAPGYDNI